ncbi:MAG: FAD-linked oxidase C-terminal domain-containing protein [Pseudomonadota bacterium]
MALAEPSSPQSQASEQAVAQAIEELAQKYGDRVTVSDDVRQLHGRDESYHPSIAPDGVFFATSTEEVSEAVKICDRLGVSIVPFGTGTSLEGGVAALGGGLCIDVSKMDRVLRVAPEDLDCTVEAGVRRKALDAHLRDSGLFFPIDPGADASIGGMAATNASGTNAVRYGTMRESVLGLTVVMADGSIVRTGGRSRKSAAGYDLTRLIVGSEGTLGIITEVTLRLHGIPEAISAATCAFPSISAAVDCVIETIQTGVPVARMELLDAQQMAACIAYSKLDQEAAPTLFFEFHGTQASVDEQAEQAGEIASSHGGSDFRWAKHVEDRNQLWQARHNAYYAAMALRPGSRGMATDVCVPISRLADCIEQTIADNKQTDLLAPIVGHVGDGNFHVTYLLDPENDEEIARAGAAHRRMVHRAIEMGGTCTGEHGVGYGKIDFLEVEHASAMASMRAIKQALDPKGILNPGKVLRQEGLS